MSHNSTKLCAESRAQVVQLSPTIVLEGESVVKPRRRGLQLPQRSNHCLLAQISIDVDVDLVALQSDRVWSVM